MKQQSMYTQYALSTHPLEQSAAIANALADSTGLLVIGFVVVCLLVTLPLDMCLLPSFLLVCNITTMRARLGGIALVCVVCGLALAKLLSWPTWIHVVCVVLLCCNGLTWK